MGIARKRYPSDVSDDERALVAPYLTLLREDAEQRGHPLREVFNGLRHIIKTGAPWRWMPNDLPPWPAVRQQARRWLAAGCFEVLAHDLSAVLRSAAGRSGEPGAAATGSRTLRHRKAAIAAATTGASARKARSCIGGRYLGQPAGPARHTGQCR